MENSRPRLDNQRPRLQRSASERGTLQRSSSLLGLLGRVPWAIKDDDYYSSSGEDEPRVAAAPPSPVVSQEEAKRARKQKLQRLFKQGVSRVVRERAEEMDRMAKKGSLYVMDAFAGRLQHGMAAMSTKPWYIFMAFRLQISSYWMWTIVASSVLHSLLVFLEPAPGRPPEDGWLSPRTLFVLEVLFIAVYALDVCLKASYMGLKNYVKKPWQKLMIAIVLLLAVDASGAVGVRFARALRPAILSVRTRSIRRFYAVVSQMLPGFLRVCLPVVFFLLLSASYAALSFGRAKSDFEDPSAAGYAIWILMVCADNYETLVNDPSTHPAYAPFIVMVIVVGSMFLLSLLLGVTYDVFIEHTTEQVKQERMKELKGLNVAFAIMDPTGTGKLSMVVWDRFLLHLMPRTTQQERALYFEIASGFADNLDVLGFMDLRQVLNYSFVNVNAVERQGKRKKWEKMPPRLARLLEGLEAMLAKRWWRHTVAAVVLLDCILLPHSIPHQGPGLMITRLTAACGAILLVDQLFQWAERMHQGSGPGPLRLPEGKSLHTKVAGWGVILHTVVVALLHCPPLLSLACSFVSYTWEVFLNPSDFHGADPYLVVSMQGGPGGSGAWEGEGVRGLNEEDVWGGQDEGELGVYGGGGGREGMCMEVDWCTDSLLMLAYTLRLIRCWRLVTLFDTLHDHVNTFFCVVPVFAQTLSFALIIAYAFAMVALEAFADKASAFSDAGMSFRTTLQLFVGVDFSAVVEATVEEVGAGALLFFVCYHVVGVLIVFNLLTAIMIQLYGEALNEKSRQGMEEQRMADQELQANLYDYNQKQRVLRLWGKRVTQGAASLNITRGTKVNSGREARRMLGAAGTKSQSLTAEELQQCQKYAKVDLLRALRERDRADNNLRTFENSFYKKVKSGSGGELNYEHFLDGETIYHRGDQHATCYFVHSGVVRLEYCDGTVETKEKGEMFGEEALVVNLATTATAIAEGAVSCVGMDRATFTEDHGTLENLGMVFLRLQRSGSFYTADAPPSDGSREGSRRSNFNFSSNFSGRSSRVLSGAGPGGPSSRTPSQADLFSSSSDKQIRDLWRSRTGRISASASAGGAGSGGGGSNSSIGSGGRRSASALSIVDQGGGGGGDGVSAADRRRGGSAASERAASVRGTMTKYVTGQSSRSDIAGGSSRLGAGAGSAGGRGEERGVAVDGRGLRPESGHSGSSSVGSGGVPTLTRSTHLARVFPVVGVSRSNSDDRGSTGSATTTTGTDDVPSSQPPPPKETTDEPRPAGLGDRPSLLQRGKGSFGGFVEADNGGGRSGPGEGDLQAPGLLSSSSSSLLGAREDSRTDSEAAAGTEVEAGVVPENGGRSGGGGAGGCPHSPTSNRSAAAAGAGADGPGTVTAPAADAAATASPRRNLSPDEALTRGLSGDAAVEDGARDERGADQGGDNQADRFEDEAYNDDHDHDHDHDHGAALKSVLREGIRQLGLSESTLGGVPSRRGSSHATSPMHCLGEPETLGIGPESGGYCGGCGGGGGRCGGGRGAAMREVASPELSPSTAPRSRKEYMLKALPTSGRNSGGGGGRTIDVSAGVSSGWSTNPPSPVMAAENERCEGGGHGDA